MAKSAFMSLQKARKEGRIEDFIREHEKDAPGDLDKLDAAIKRPASRSLKEAPATSKPDASDD